MTTRTRTKTATAHEATAQEVSQDAQSAARRSPREVSAVPPHRNEVIIAGRLAAAALAKQLPSGDQVVTWRLIVDRVVTDRRGTANDARKVDVVDCNAFGAKLRRQALGWQAGEVIEVTGALRRRFWRGAGGLQSRCEIEADSAVRRPSPGRRSTAAVSRRRKPE